MNMQWFRFTGSGGNVLATSSPGCCTCGTLDAVWMSDLDPDTPGLIFENCDLPSITACCGDYCGTTVGGTFPSIEEGIVSRVLCGAWGRGADWFGGAEVTCRQPRLMSLVNCEDFYLFQLPSLPSGGWSYCTENQ